MDPLVSARCGRASDASSTHDTNVTSMVSRSVEMLAGEPSQRAIIPATVAWFRTTMSSPPRLSTAAWGRPSNKGQTTNRENGDKTESILPFNSDWLDLMTASKTLETYLDS